MKYRFVFLISFLSLLGERLWNRLWPPLSVAVFFAGLALLNAPLLFGAGWHVFLLAAFAAALIWSLLRLGAPFRFPMPADVRRHIEQASALAHRPLQALRDKPVEGLRRDSLLLWERHREKAALVLEELRIYKPHSTVPHQDRHQLRYAALIVLALGLTFAQGETIPRFKQALAPDVAALTDQKAIALDLWIVPPDYTHQATVFLATAKQGVLARNEATQVPANSLLKLRVSGANFAPRFTYAGEKRALTEVTPGNYTLEMPLVSSGDLRVRNWLATLGEWQINVADDTAPAVSISKIETTPRAGVKITYRAQDDHGLARLTGIVEARNQTYRFEMPTDAGENELTHTEDLTAHPAAGLSATLTLEAEDAVGHKTVSAPAGFALPQRRFNNPTAQQIVAQRKVLILDKSLPARGPVVQSLSGIADNPALYKGEIAVFMSLASAIKRLVYDRTEEGADSVISLLWEVALRIEDGGLSLAQRDLHQSLEKLSQALKDKNLSQEQLQQILDEVQKKMQQYVRTMAAELQQRMAESGKAPVISQELAQRFMKNLDINKLLEQMNQLSQANSREDLQKLADELKNSIDNLDMNRLGEMQKKQAEQMQALQNLQDIIHAQQSLFDKTNKSDDPADLKDRQKEQSDLRKQLGDSLRKLGDTGAEIPENFAKADQAMKGSAAALGKGQQREALPQQQAALDELQKGLDSTVKKMAEQMQQSLLSSGDGGYGAGYDPLGRMSGQDDGSVKIPGEKERRRVQEIIQELRHRSNEPNRTKVERDYIDRLLDQF